MEIAPSGRQFEIASGEQRATIVEVGGGVREYSRAGRPVLDPYRLDAICDGAHGAPLIPWPNRLADGRYRFDGVDYQVALTEPEKHNAIHGFLRWRPWQAVERERERIVMATHLYPLEGYPFALDVRVAYELSAGGLAVSTTAVNAGGQPCPYGAGQHPYLSAGGGLIDECTLELPAKTRIVTDATRQLPMGRELVEDTRLDFRIPRRLGAEQIDFAFTDFAREGSGMAVTRLTGPDGHAVELWVDRHYGVIELYTGDALAPSRRRRGLAVEPMTCEPNAFQSGRGLICLQAGGSLTCCWGVRLLARS
ncbi:MAG: aldose 1-epimerase family protein [Solirubrobacteraceae bacterium]|jgi:aldose 1-epimerase